MNHFTRFMKLSGSFILLFGISVFLCSFKAVEAIMKKNPPNDKSLIDSSHIGGLKFRSLGPAIASGRIADFAVNPENPTEYYVGTASGGLWKTTNNGTTFKPIFDKQAVFSIGCLAIDPKNPYVVWVGTGENNTQRNLAYGDGVYKTLDGGKSWKNMGLKKSEHIGKIMIDPRNSDVVYVCSQGPAWGTGGERGLYKTTDGGKSWEAILTVGEYTGITDMEMDPRNPDILYAAAHQRERRVYSKIDGGPESAIYKSTNAGKSWKKLTRGLPSGDVGRIGLALSPPNPDVLYAIIELPENKGGFYRSLDMGESWKKRSEEVAGSPQYYHEIYADPIDVDRVISMDVRNMVTDDGGKTFTPLGEKNKHVDNHALWIDPTYPNHYLMGCDGGVYESFDRGQNWIFKSNLPITQFYHVRTDDRYPFYFVYGGTQDNGSWIGPSRTNKRYMINEDWIKTNGGDGYLSIPEPGNPDISYASSQYGGLVRFDWKTGNRVYIKPQPKTNETYRFNWNMPHFISPHNITAIYCAANKVFKSTNRGDSWKEISPDLSRQIDVNTLPMMGKIWSPEAIAKSVSTSPFGNIFALAESPLKQGLLYAGTDDGLIHVSDNDGETWARYEQFPGIPHMTFVNYLLPSQHDVNVVYAAFDGRKNNSDFNPYILKSTDRGKTWTPIHSDLPSGTVYVIQEDHVNSNILFIGTEWGVFTTINGGKNWFRIKSGLPTIQVKDLDIQRRENDLAVATFGRGFYILEDYSYLRELTEEVLQKEAHFFPVKDALLFYPASNSGSMGDVYFRSMNPPVAASFTYYLKDLINTKRKLRKLREKKDMKEGKPISYPSQEKLQEEDVEEAPFLLFTIYQENGQVVTRVKTGIKKGINRVTWDLRFPSMTSSSSRSRFRSSGAPYVPPGNYKVSLSKSINGNITTIAEPVTFRVKAFDNSTIAGGDADKKFKFMKEVDKLYSSVNSAIESAIGYRTEIKSIQKALLTTPAETDNLMKKTRQIDKKLFDILVVLSGSPAKPARIDVNPPTIQSRLDFVVRATSSTWHGITGSQYEQFNIVKDQFRPVLEKLEKVIMVDFPELEKNLSNAGVPWTLGRTPVWKLNY